MRHGWRYMDLRPEHVLRMTHKEFLMLSEESVEKTHDSNEKIAMASLMNAVSSRGKGKKGKLPKLTDLYDRDSVVGGNKETEVEDKFERHKAAQDWLTNFNLDALNDRQEEKEGGI